MCGRYELIVGQDQIQAHFSFVKNEFYLESRDEIYPSQKCPIITNEMLLEKALWGFKVDFTKQLIINARQESILEKDLFSRPFEYHRCLILASAFFEWDEHKIKHRIHLKDQDLFVMAGILSFINQQPRFTMITKDSTKEMKKVHSRVPVIFNDKEAYDYLNNSKILSYRMLANNDPDLVIKKDVNHEMLTLF